MHIIRQIAEAAKQQEFQTALKLGYNIPNAIHMAWLVETEVLMLGREGILEGLLK